MVFVNSMTFHDQRAPCFHLACNPSSSFDFHYLTPLPSYLLNLPRGWNKMQKKTQKLKKTQLQWFTVIWHCLLNKYHRRRRWGWGECAPPKKIRKKYFSGNYYVKFGHFSDKNHVKLGNLIKFGYFDNFPGKNHVTFGHFVNFSYIFFGQKCLAPLKLTELLRL